MELRRNTIADPEFRLVLPGDAGDAAEGWLGPGSTFRRTGLVSGRFAALSLYTRPLPAGCP